MSGFIDNGINVEHDDTPKQDIVERLRNHSRFAEGADCNPLLYSEAADEIERLRAMLKVADDTITTLRAISEHWPG